jgi:hypothetical protein
MNTDIEYLRQLELDLKDAAVREAARRDGPAATPATTPRPGHRWGKVAGVAAAFHVVAGAIGVVAGGLGSGEDMFQQVGDAVSSGGDGAGSAPEPAASPPPNLVGVTRDEDSVGGGDDLGADPQAGPRPQQDLSKIVRDGRIGVVVDDGTFNENVDELTIIAEQNGGFILSSSSERERSGTFVLRIPSGRFDRAIGQIRDLGTVRFQQIRGDDVTAEFIDFQARLRILQARRQLLFRLFQDADTTDEILRLASQLDDVQLRIEQIQGQLRFIDDQVAEATLRVTIQERNAPRTEPPTDVENPNLGSSFDLAVQGFLRIVGAVIVGLGYLIPLTVLGLLIWLAVRLAQRRRGPA